jgi:hypothetical protein
VKYPKNFLNNNIKFKIIYIDDSFSIASILVASVNARTNPRFDMRDKDGIIFDPIAPRAGERLIAKCTLVGLTDTDKRSVSIFY